MHSENCQSTSLSNIYVPNKSTPACLLSRKFSPTRAWIEVAASDVDCSPPPVSHRAVTSLPALLAEDIAAKLLNRSKVSFRRGSLNSWQLPLSLAPVIAPSVCHQVCLCCSFTPSSGHWAGVSGGHHLSSVTLFQVISYCK